MLILTLEPLSGHIERCITTSIEIQTSFPQHTFYLKFNEVRIPVTNRNQMLTHYNKELQS